MFYSDIYTVQVNNTVVLNDVLVSSISYYCYAHTLLLSHKLTYIFILYRELNKKESMWVEKQGEATSTVERIKYMQEELQNYKYVLRARFPYNPIDVSVSDRKTSL